MGFFTRLEERAEIDSLLCVGLDPHPADLPQHTPAAARDFCLRLIEATAEAGAGLQAQRRLLRGVRRRRGGGPAGGDRRRPAGNPGDPGCQARRYRLHRGGVCPRGLRDAGGARHHAQPLSWDATLSSRSWRTPGMASSCCARPPTPARATCRICDWPGRGYDAVRERWRAWRRPGMRSDNLGLVVGATHPQALRRVRRAGARPVDPGARGGRAGRRPGRGLQAGLRPDGLGLLVPVSRAISRADRSATGSRWRCGMKSTISVLRTEREVPAHSVQRTALHHRACNVGNVWRMGCWRQAA